MALYIFNRVISFFDAPAVDAPAAWTGDLVTLKVWKLTNQTVTSMTRVMLILMLFNSDYLLQTSFPDPYIVLCTSSCIQCADISMKRSRTAFSSIL